MATLNDRLNTTITKKDNNKNTPKGSQNHMQRNKAGVGARTKSVCYKVNPETYERFQAIVEARGQKANALINQWITEYVNQNEEKWLG